MNKGRWVLAGIVVAVAVTVLDWVFNGIILKDAYVATASLWRAEADMMRLMPWGWVATLLMSLILVYIYHRGYEGKGSALAEGLRFGFWIGLFVAIPMVVWSYIMLPMPIRLAASWFVVSLVEFLVAGILVGLIYKPRASA